MMTGKQLRCNLLIVINPMCLSKTLLESSLAYSRSCTGYGRIDPFPFLSTLWRGIALGTDNAPFVRRDERIKCSQNPTWKGVIRRKKECLVAIAKDAANLIYSVIISFDLSYLWIFLFGWVASSIPNPKTPM